MKLFSGTPGFLGGLSNEKILAKECPKEFKKENKWSSAAMQIFFLGGKIDHWEWKDITNREKQLACFRGLLMTFDLPHEDKTAVAGWMLSEMLTKVPDHVPVEKKKKG